MSHHLRTVGVCTLSFILAASLAVGFIGYPAQAVEPTPLSEAESSDNEPVSLSEAIVDLLIQKREVLQGAFPEATQTQYAETVSGASQEPMPETIQDDPWDASGEPQALPQEEDPVEPQDSSGKDSLSISQEPSLSASQEGYSNAEGLSSLDAGNEQLEASIVLEGGTLYANGVAVCIKKDQDGKTYIYNGSGTEKLVADACNVSTVYGGGKNTPVDGDTSIRIEGVDVRTVYGGGYSDGTGSADVSGGASVTITGTADADSVHGGGYAYASKGNASANVAGKVTVDIPAQPTSNHGNIYGGGNAVAQKGYSASATVGSVSASIVGRTYSIRGGGSASLTTDATGAANADVHGAISVSCIDVDIREVYGAGYASGATAHATAESVFVNVNGNEMMILQSGGQAYSGGNADVLGPAQALIENCSNLYGYLLGGGRASSGGTAKVAISNLSVVDSVIPVDVQSGSLVAAATYAGGSADGAGSDASVLGRASVSLQNCTGAGSVYGGGDASGGARAQVGEAVTSVKEASSIIYPHEGEDVLCALSVFAGGETDDPQASPVEPGSIAVSIESAELEHVWGGLIVKGSPVSSACASSLQLVGANNSLSTLTCFDAVSLSSPLHINAFLEKAKGVPTELTVSGIAEGEPVVVCEDDDSSSDWFSRKGGKLAYAVEEVGGSPASVWRMGKDDPNTPDIPTGPGDVEVVLPSNPDAPAVSVENAEGLADRLLSEEDRAAIESGSSISFAIKLEKIDEPPAKAAEAIQAAISEAGVSLAFHLDIGLYKKVDGSEAPLSSTGETGTAIRFSIDVPHELSKDQREFSVLRTHEKPDGTMEETLLADLDDDPATVTFETDRFSVYSLVYADAASGDPETPGVSDDPEKPGTPEGDGTGGQGNPDIPNQPDEEVGNNQPKGDGDAGASDLHAKRQPFARLFPQTGDAFSMYATFGVGVAALALACACALRLRLRGSKAAGRRR